MPSCATCRGSLVKASRANRREFIKASMTTAAGMAVASALPEGTLATAEPLHSAPVVHVQTKEAGVKPSRIRFSVIGINHDHIHAQVGAVIRGGGQLVSFYAKEPDLAAAFAKRYPQAPLA